MRTNKEHSKAIEQAKENLEDLNERGSDAVGGNVLEFMESILTPDEMAESGLRVSIIRELIKARQEKGISQKKIGRIERSKAACYCKNGKRRYQPAVEYDSKGIGSIRKDVGGCSAGDRKQIAIWKNQIGLDK